MDSLLHQLPLIAFLVFYYFYGARFVGALIALARPIRGLEARPIYWDAGIAALFVAFGVWTAARLGFSAPWWAYAFALGFAAIGAAMLFDWAKRRLLIEDGHLVAEAPGARRLRLPLSAVARVSIGPGGLFLLIERGDGGGALRAPLSMDGLDGVYAALARAGTPGPSFEAFLQARRGQRRR